MDEIKARPRQHSHPPSQAEQEHYADLIAGLRLARQARGYSQANLEHRIGVSEGLVAKWETQARLPGAFLLMCWCCALGVRLTLEKEPNA